MTFHGLLTLREKRGYKDLNNYMLLNYFIRSDICLFFAANVVKYDNLLFMGWAHYGPFFIMGHQLVLHYLPNLLLSSSFAVLRPKIGLQIAAVLCTLQLGTFRNSTHQLMALRARRRAARHPSGGNIGIFVQRFPWGCGSIFSDILSLTHAFCWQYNAIGTPTNGPSIYQ